MVEGNRSLWLASARSSLAGCGVPTTTTPKPLSEMEISELRKLATRPARFLRRLQNTGDFADLPMRYLVLEPPADDIIKSFGIQGGQVLWDYQRKFLLPGGHWVISFIEPGPEASASHRVLVSWDLVGTEDPSIVYPSYCVSAAVGVDSPRAIECSISFRESENCFVALIWAPHPSRLVSPFMPHDLIDV